MSPKQDARGYDALKPGAFGKLGSEEFELLCEQLVRREILIRHGAGVDVESNRGPSIAGFDLRYQAPTTPAKSDATFRAETGAEPLTVDAQGLHVVYSIKTGANQIKTAKKEARHQSEWAMEALRSGGHLFLLLSEPKAQAAKPAPVPAVKSAKTKPAKTAKASAKKEPAKSQPQLRRELADIYHARLKTLDPAAADPGDRIHVVDAADLRDYLVRTRFTIAAALRAKLGLPAVPQTLDLEAFGRAHLADRRGARPNFVWDAQREVVADAILDVLALPISDDPFGRVVRLISPPGVGKTRLLVEALTDRASRRNQSVRDRVFATMNASAAIDALEMHDLLGAYCDAILVVDDVAHHELDRLVRSFAARNEARRAALVAVTPAAPEARDDGPIRWLELDPARDEACDEILRAELGTEPDHRLRAIVKGYPWFALIVARELAKAPQAPAPQTRSAAVDIALCQRGTQDLAREVRRRGAALAIVMLLEGARWEDLARAEREELLEVFANEFATWPEVIDAIQACAERGLVRPGAGGAFRYVTPAIVELEIARRWLAPEPPTPPLRDRLVTDRMRSRLQRVLERMAHLDFPASALADVAAPLVRSVESASCVAELSGLTGSELIFAARYVPQRVARALRLAIEATTETELRADRHHRRSLVFALEEVAARRGTFDDAEAALFALALAENETYGNNATSVWAGLYDVALNTTYLPFAERAQRLKERLEDPRPESRRLALRAVERILEGRSTKRTIEPADGPHLRPTVGELRAAMEVSWGLVARRMRDANRSVATEAVTVVGRVLRQGVRHGLLPVMEAALRDGAPDVADDALRRVREAIELAEIHDRARLQENEAAWSALVSRFAARDFSARLRQGVGTWGPATLRNEDAADEQLAVEGLAPPSPLLGELDWLASREAVRAVPFAAVAARVDVGAILLDPLLSRAQVAPELVSGYLMGLAESGRGTEADDALVRLRCDDRCREAAAAALWRVGASSLRLEWLIADIEARRLEGAALTRFGTGRWADGLRDDDLARLVAVLENVGSDSAIVLALDLVHDRMRKHPEVTSWDERLASVFSRMPPGALNEGGHIAHVWSRAAAALLQRGRTRAVARSAIASIAATPPNSLATPEVIEVLRNVASANGAVAWEELRLVLEHNDELPWALEVACREADVAASLPRPAVQRWVGGDRRRALMIAEMVSMHGSPDVPELARHLLKQFGAASDVAAVLRSDLASTRRAVSSLAEFAARQRRTAERWLSDDDPEVRRFAEQTIAELRVEGDEHAAREEYERRRWGT